MGGKKKKGAKEPRDEDSANPQEDGGGRGAVAEGKKSKKKKKNDFDDNYDEDLAELVNELGLEGGDGDRGQAKEPAATNATPTTTNATPTTSTSTLQPSDSPGSVVVEGTRGEGARAGTGEGDGDKEKGNSHEDVSNTMSSSPTGTQPTSRAGVVMDTRPGATGKETTEDKKKKKKKKKKTEDVKSNAAGVSDGVPGDSPASETTPSMTTPPSTAASEEGQSTSVAGHETVEIAAEGGEEVGVEEDKKKKKKKKKKEEEKKSSKGPGKSAISKIKKMQALLEEEKVKREQEALAQQRAEEERERARLEKLQQEKEKKERLKQKEKERKLRRKQEGKPVTKKEKEEESRRQAQLALLREQGINIPEKDAAVTEKKKVVYGSRQRTKKTDTSNKAESMEGEHETQKGQEQRLDESLEVEEGIGSWEELEDNVPPSSGGVDSWEDLEEQEEGAIEAVKEHTESTVSVEVANEVREEESDDDEEEEGGEQSSESNSEDEDSNLSPQEKAKIHMQRRRERHEAERSLDILRSPVVCVLGHVDTGKTKILDKIRKTNVQDGEAGGITQQIGATFVPVEAVRDQTKMLKEFSKSEITIPGLLIIDTPGHESFSNLRTRGSSMCDLAILVVDIMHGLEAQTKESLNLLKRGKVPFVVALNKVDRLYDWHRNPNSSIRDTLKKQKQASKDQFDERVKEVIREFAEESLNVAMFWEKVDFTDYLPLVPTSAITGDGMGDLIALLVQHSVKNLASTLRLSMEVEALVMEVKVIPGLGTTIDVILRNGILREGDTMVLTGNEGPFVATVRALLMPQPLRELRVKNAYVSHTAVMAAQGIKVTAKGDLEKTLPGTSIRIAKRPAEVDVLKEEAAIAMKNVLNAVKLQDRGVYVQASTLGSLEALLEFLKTSKIPYSGINIGPVHKRDVMKASVMLEHDSQWAVILAFDVRVERDAQEMADSLGVKIFSADIIYHLFDSFLKHRQELREKNRQLYRSIAVFPCRLRILPNCIFNTRDPIVVGVVVESGIVKPGTPLTVPTKSFTDIGIVTSLEVNHKTVESVRKGTEVCVKIEPVGGDAPRLYGRHFDHTDMLVSKVSRESIDAVKNYFREDLNKSDWQLIIELKKLFQIM